jgi:hypothetical protein
VTSFLALYSGESITAAKIVAVTADSQLVRDFAGRLLNGPADETHRDPVLEELEQGRRRALRLVERGKK